MAPTISSNPRFSTILVSRGNDNRPSDLEFGLRPHCRRLIVKEKPLSGAHLLVTSERIAVRAYYPCDIQELRDQEEQEERRRRQQTIARFGKSRAEESDSRNDDFDGISSFFSSFQLALVIFVLSPTNTNKRNLHISIAEQLNDIGSHFHRAQRLSMQHQQEKTTQSTVTTEIDSQKRRSISTINSTWKNCVLLLPDTESAIQNLIAVADSVAPERKAIKRVLFQRLETKYFLPPSSLSKRSCDGGKLPTAIVKPVQTITMNESATSAAAAVHVAEGFRNIARAFELPNGEEDILMSELGDLKTIATADDLLLAKIPIDQRTRKVLHSFFGSLGGIEEGVNKFRGRFRQTKYPGSKSLTSLSMQLFPPSTATPSLLSTRKSPHGRPPLRSSIHMFRPHHQVPRFQQPEHYEHSVNLNTREKLSWEPRTLLARNSDVFYPSNNEILDTNDVFEISTINQTKDYPIMLLPPGSTRDYWRANVEQPQDIDLHRSQVSPDNPSISSFFGTNNAIDNFVTSGSQLFDAGYQLHQQNLLPHRPNRPSFENLHQHQVDQESTFSQHYTKSQPTKYGNGSIHRRTNIYSHDPSGLSFSSQHQR